LNCPVLGLIFYFSKNFNEVTGCPVVARDGTVAWNDAPLANKSLPRATVLVASTPLAKERTSRPESAAKSAGVGQGMRMLGRSSCRPPAAAKRNRLPCICWGAQLVKSVQREGPLSFYLEMIEGAAVTLHCR